MSIESKGEFVNPEKKPELVPYVHGLSGDAPLKRAEELAKKDDITPQEFKEFVTQMWKLGESIDPDDFWGRTIPNNENPFVKIGGSFKDPDEKSQIISINFILDGDINNIGEIVRLRNHHVLGLHWTIHPHGSYQSTVLKRKVELQESDYNRGGILNTKDLQRLAGMIFDAYKQGQKPQAT